MANVFNIIRREYGDSTEITFGVGGLSIEVSPHLGIRDGVVSGNRLIIGEGSTLADEIQYPDGYGPIHRAKRDMDRMAREQHKRIEEIHKKASDRLHGIHMYHKIDGITTDLLLRRTFK